jgi:hypothetical protein
MLPYCPVFLFNKQLGNPQLYRWRYRISCINHFGSGDGQPRSGPAGSRRPAFGSHPSRPKCPPPPCAAGGSIAPPAAAASAAVSGGGARVGRCDSDYPTRTHRPGSGSRRPGLTRPRGVGRARFQVWLPLG